MRLTKSNTQSRFYRCARVIKRSCLGEEIFLTRQNLSFLLLFFGLVPRKQRLCKLRSLKLLRIIFKLISIWLSKRNLSQIVSDLERFLRHSDVILIIVLQKIRRGECLRGSMVRSGLRNIFTVFCSIYNATSEKFPN